MVRELICICCPVGCRLSVDTSSETITVTGNACKRGISYGIDEVSNPKRMITSTVRVRGGRFSLTSVKTASPVEKGRISEVLKALADVEVEAPLTAGSIILRDVAGTGADIVVTRTVKGVG